MKRAKGKRQKAKGKIRVFTLKVLFFPFLSLCFFVPAANLSAQTGGPYQIEKAVVASGGARSAGGRYALESTSGQPLAGGFFQTMPYSTYHGFWTPALAPTAANVTIGGRVLTAAGQGIRNARIMLTAPDGSTRFSLSGSFGYYRFNDVQVGATYVLSVFSKRYVFGNPTLVVSVNDQLETLDFVAASEVENLPSSPAK